MKLWGPATALGLFLLAMMPLVAHAGTCNNPAEAGAKTAPIVEGTTGPDTYIYTTVTDLGPPANPAAGFKDIGLVVPSAGLYKIVERVQAQSGNQNSWYVEILGQPDVFGNAMVINDTSAPYGVFQTKYVNVRTTPGTEGGPDREWWLPAGPITVRYNGREADTWLDCIGLDVWPTYTPSITPTFTPTATITHTGTGTWSPSPTSSATATATGTVTGTITWSSTPTNTASRTATGTITGTITLTSTYTASATETGTPTYSPTMSASPTNSPTGTPTVTHTATATASMTTTYTQTLTATPGKNLHLKIYDEHDLLVRDLGTVLVFTPAGSLGADHSPFSPEQHGVLNISAGPDGAWSWYGETDGGGQAANGRYTLRLSQWGGAELEYALWLVRGAADLGTATVYPNPVRQAPVWIQLTLKVGATAQARIYNTAGELVTRFDFPQGVFRLPWDLKTAGGEDIASGLYLVQLHYKTRTSVRDYETLKLAVIR